MHTHIQRAYYYYCHYYDYHNYCCNYYNYYHCSYYYYFYYYCYYCYYHCCCCCCCCCCTRSAPRMLMCSCRLAVEYTHAESTPQRGHAPAILTHLSRFSMASHLALRSWI